MNPDIPYLFALTKIDKIGPVLAKQLIAYCGGPQDIFNKSVRELAEIPQIGPLLAKNIYESDPLLLAEQELAFVRNKGIEIIGFWDERYPRRLRNYDDSPILLYATGEMDLNHHRMVGIVGTRKPTEYGTLMTERIVDGLQSYDAVIVSGMAYGIDTMAHRRSVENNMATIGVLGHGLDRIYPFVNRDMANRMIKNGGLLTEFPSGTNPDRENFPMRNRIIAALSDAVLVVESGEKGGSIITAEFANAYNKDVFAVPGRIGDENSAGCNKLIKIHKAYLAESAKDIAYIMRWEEMDAARVAQPSLFPDLNEEEMHIIDALRAAKELTIDNLHHAVKKPMSELSGMLLQLEFKGMVRSLPGKKYVLA